MTIQLSNSAAWITGFGDLSKLPIQGQSAGDSRTEETPAAPVMPPTTEIINMTSPVPIVRSLAEAAINEYCRWKNTDKNKIKVEHLAGEYLRYYRMTDAAHGVYLTDDDNTKCIAARYEFPDGSSILCDYEAKTYRVTA